MGCRYQIKRLWNGIAPILTTNLIEAGVVEAAANESLSLSAVSAFDRYTNSPLTSPAAAKELDASPTNNRRRRRRNSSQAKQAADDLNVESSTAPTPNDNFFEYQRRMGYTFGNNQSDGLLRQQLKETHIIDAIIYYLQHFHANNGGENNSSASNLPQQRLAGSIIHELQSDSPEVTIDLWAAVQRWKGSHHKFHVHDGAVVSGVYYSSCPMGCAPLVLRRPLLDGDDNVNCEPHYNNNYDGGERDDDEVIHPNNGQLVIFPSWLSHGVPLEKEQHYEEPPPSLPRVSWAFNLNARLVYVGNAWDVTRPS
mmetsp:Transcript_19709/g.28076  ORF Transcript_19709/g.28076 Transcript_19709/m.28076 type:complete len:310 (+) Transcript_19709:172-1101(+)